MTGVASCTPIMIPEIMGKMHMVTCASEARPLYWKTCGSQEFTDTDLPKSLGWWFPASTVFTLRSYLLTCGHIFFYFYLKDGSVTLASNGDRLGVLQNFLLCTEQPHNKGLSDSKY